MSPLIMAIRPKTLGATLAPVLAGAALSLRTPGSSKLVLSMTLLSALCLQIVANLVNDYSDFEKGADKPDRLGPPRVTSSGLVSISKVKKYATFFTVAALVFGVPVVMAGGMPIVVIGLCGIFCAYAYTSGKFALAYIGVADFVVFAFFGPLATAGTCYVTGGTFNAEAIYLGCGIGLLAVSLLAINNLRDINQDRLVNKKTLAVRFGIRFAVFQVVMCLIAGSLLTLWLSPLAGIISTVFSIRALSIVTSCGAQGTALNRALSVIGICLLLLGPLVIVGELCA